MLTEYKEYFQDLFVDIHEHVLRVLRDTDKEYKELLDSNMLDSLRMQKILNVLKNDDKEFVVKYRDNSINIEWIEKERLYLQGLKDCVKFLKEIEIIK
ncbi:hypothetical protein PV797_09225 [Clostridiaceae bacterium M8S5]|nr:hypothetical protein PV797_09225 [Clostridiaceae bacterium M8S5]